MKLKNTFMSKKLCVKILKYHYNSKNFPLFADNFYFYNLDADNFFSHLQLANIFFNKKVTPPTPDKNNGLSLR